MIKRKVKAKKKKVSKVRKRKNPFSNANDVAKYIENNSTFFQYLASGAHAEIYKFKTNKKIVINTKILLPGEYILKLLKSEYLYWKPKQIDYLVKLSKYGLIPKIYIITKNYFIGKYINGYTLLEIKEKYEHDEIDDETFMEIDDKIEHLIYIWKELKFYHNDLHDENILISKDLKHVYLIDPSPLNH